ncbi:MAG: hypothetical protein GXO84_09120 [Chlorobi bacterium]|nr:hypothetical protein [Chlorobiota bacterium]
MKNKLFNSITIFATGMSAADWLWKLITIFIIGGSGAATGFLASDLPFFNELGIIAWIAIGLIASISISLIFYLIKSAQGQTAYAEYTRALSQIKSHINPLQDSFKDLIIPIEDLRIPGILLHENKHFKRCSFVGPGAIALMGGTYIYTNFYETGDIIPIPDNTMLTGIVILKNCTIEECKFYRTTLMIDEKNSKTVASSVPGMTVAGK